MFWVCLLSLTEGLSGKVRANGLVGYGLVESSGVLVG